LGIPALALTDENNLYGAVGFFKAAKEENIKPILGAIVTTKNEEVVLLVQNAIGYSSLCEIISRRNLEQDFCLSDSLPASQEGLLVTTEYLNLARALSGKIERERLFLELVRPGRSISHERQIMETAKSLGLRVLASSDIYFFSPEDFELHEILLAIGRTELLDNVKEEAARHKENHLHSPQEMRKLFSDCPEALTNTLRIAEAIDFDLLARKPVFPKVQEVDGKSAEQQLWEMTFSRARTRYAEITDAVRKRIQYELGLISKLGLADYFLVVSDIVDHARELGTPTAGRGSGASSTVSYCLGITNVDPLKYELPFERFLNEGRKDFPDLDIDFCWRLRDDVIDYVYKKYGDDHVAMVATYGTFQPRSAFRETAKVFGLSDPTITRVLKNLSRGQRNNLPVELDMLEEILRIAKRIEGFPHHISVHCGGVVITPEPVCRYAPLQRAEKGVTITQYDKDGAEAVGLVKLDLLGNRALSTIREAIDLVEQTRCKRITPENLPDSDEKTVALLQAGNTLGCNQLESPAMRNLLQMMRPSGVSGIMKVLALIRPGAASLGMKERFIRRERGLEKPCASDSKLLEVLKDTHGIMLYEDDALLVVRCLAGLSTEEADKFRRAVTKCKSDTERFQLSEEFLTLCRRNGTDLALAKDLWVQMAKFNSFSFCRAHAASYAVLAYAVAYLKAHYPAQFWVAALNNNAGMYEKRVYIEAAKRQKIKILLPCVNKSGAEFTLEDSAIRVGLQSVSGLSQKSIETIVTKRESEPYRGLSDFLARTGIGQKETETLIRCGAFDLTGFSRPQLLWQLYTQPPVSGRSFSLDDSPDTLPRLDDYTEEKKFRDEWELLGLSARKHPIRYFMNGYSRNGPLRSSDLRQHIGNVVRLAGILAAVRDAETSKGEVMRFLTLEDESGLFEVTLFPDTYRRERGRIAGLGPYLVTGKVEDQYDSLTITAESLCTGANVLDFVASNMLR
jgi:DNA-directed DNA polymerase III PolC